MTRAMLVTAAVRLAAFLLVVARVAWGQPDTHDHGGAANPPPPLTISVGSLEGATGREVEVPILVKGASGIGPMEMVLVYDPAVLEAKAEQCASKGPLLTSCLLESRSDPSGKMAITWVTSDAINGDGKAVLAHFKVRGEPGQKSALTLDKVRAWGREAPHLDALVTTEPGQFLVTRSWPWLLIALIAAAVLLVLGAWVVWRRRQARPALTAAAPAAAAQPFAQPGQPVPAQRFCPTCQRPVPAGKKFCTFDGTRID